MAISHSQITRKGEDVNKAAARLRGTVKPESRYTEMFRNRESEANVSRSHGIEPSPNANLSPTVQPALNQPLVDLTPKTSPLQSAALVPNPLVPNPLDIAVKLNQQ